MRSLLRWAALSCWVACVPTVAAVPVQGAPEQAAPALTVPDGWLTPTRSVPSPLAGGVFEIALPTRPFVQQVWGNRHVADLHVDASMLELIVGWDWPADRAERIRVPWVELLPPRALPVSVPTGEPLAGTLLAPVAHERAAARTLLDAHDLGTAALADLIGVRTLPGTEVILAVFADRILVLDPAAPEGARRKEIHAPPGHVLYAFDLLPERGGLCLVLATRSDQGFRDGELFASMMTTQVFAIRP